MMMALRLKGLKITVTRLNMFSGYVHAEVRLGHLESFAQWDVCCVLLKALLLPAWHRFSGTISEQSALRKEGAVSR